jgi:hypothetical protein
MIYLCHPFGLVGKILYTLICASYPADSGSYFPLGYSLGKLRSVKMKRFPSRSSSPTPRPNPERPQPTHSPFLFLLSNLGLSRRPHRPPHPPHLPLPDRLRAARKRTIGAHCWTTAARSHHVVWLSCCLLHLQCVPLLVVDAVNV